MIASDSGLPGDGATCHDKASKLHLFLSTEVEIPINNFSFKTFYLLFLPITKVA